MEHDEEALAPTQAVARQVRAIRERRRMTAAKLAEEMTRVGVKWDRGTVAKLETGRRENVSVAELLALAAVLSVSPVWLLVPTVDDAPYKATPTQTEPAQVVRNWIRGDRPLPGTDWRLYVAEGPSEWGMYLSPEEWEEHVDLARRVAALEQRQVAQERGDG
jgi:transcriptional regulator with XRE-family HTH domain